MRCDKSRGDYLATFVNYKELPSKHKHLYNVGPTLGRLCTNSYRNVLCLLGTSMDTYIDFIFSNVIVLCIVLHNIAYVYCLTITFSWLFCSLSFVSVFYLSNIIVILWYFRTLFMVSSTVHCCCLSNDCSGA